MTSSLRTINISIFKIPYTLLVINVGLFVECQPKRIKNASNDFLCTWYEIAAFLFRPRMNFVSYQFSDLRKSGKHYFSIWNRLNRYIATAPTGHSRASRFRINPTCWSLPNWFIFPSLISKTGTVQSEKPSPFKVWENISAGSKSRIFSPRNRP